MKLAIMTDSSILFIYSLSSYFMSYPYMITSNTVVYDRFYDALHDCSNIIICFVHEL